jgi:hypothetical protein
MPKGVSLAEDTERIKTENLIFKVFSVTFRERSERARDRF